MGKTIPEVPEWELKHGRLEIGEEYSWWEPASPVRMPIEPEMYAESFMDAVVCINEQNAENAASHSCWNHFAPALSFLISVAAYVASIKMYLMGSDLVIVPVCVLMVSVPVVVLYGRYWDDIVEAATSTMLRQDIPDWDKTYKSDRFFK